MATKDPDYHLNVPMDSDMADRTIRQERAWSGFKLSVFAVVFLAICLVVLYLMAGTTSQTTWGDWLLPWPS